MDIAELQQIVERIEIDLHICKEALETLRPIGLDIDAQVRDKFQNNYSAHVVNYLQGAIHRDALMAIWRMWDRAKNVQSIPRVMRELKNTGTVDEIKAKRREAMLGILAPAEIEKLIEVPEDKEAIERMAHRDADAAAAAVDDRIAEIRTLCDDPGLQEIFQRNASWRHKNIAHALETTRMEREAKKADIEIVDPKWGNLFDLKERTNPIVVGLKVLVADTSIFPEDSEKIFARYAAAFWGSIKENPE